MSQRNTLWILCFYRLSFVAALVGYLVWGANAVRAGIGLNELQSVLGRESSALSSLRGSVENIAGVTTLTQLAPFAVVAGFILHRIGRTNRLYLIFIPLALVRVMFNAERLAIIEVVVPLTVVWSIVTLGANRHRRLIQFLPVYGLAGLIIVFAAAEYVRTWVYYQNYTELSYPIWVMLRMVGYYVTGYNNSALYFYTGSEYTPIPYHSVSWFWNFPGLQSIIPYPHSGNAEPVEGWIESLEQYANPEFNNTGSFLVIGAEIGVIPAAIALLVTGLIVGSTFKAAVRGSAVYLIAYALLIVGLLELPRFLYWSYGRFFPIVLLLSVFVLLAPKFRKAGGTRDPAATQSGYNRASRAKSIQADSTEAHSRGSQTRRK